MPIEIKNTSGEVIHTHEGDSLAGANLADANLAGANLRGIYVNEHTKF